MNFAMGLDQVGDIDRVQNSKIQKFIIIEKRVNSSSSNSDC